MGAALWWPLESKIESRIGRVETLLTEHLSVRNRARGKLKGAAPSHTPSPRPPPPQRS